MAECWIEGKVKEMAAINLKEEVAEGASLTAGGPDGLDGWKIPAEGEKGVRWKAREVLLTFFGGSPSPASTSDAGLEETASKLNASSSAAAPTASVLQANSNIDSPRKGAAQTQASRMRRLRGLGAANGTPARGLLSSASALLPDDVAEEKEQEKDKERSKLPAARERKSRLVAPTPSKLRLTATRGDEITPSTLRPPEVAVPKSLAVPAPGSAAPKEVKEAIQARERRLASPRKIPQFGAPAGPTRKRRVP
ncbi:MAG: hypothetical protein INR71_08370 [Terriglobus roseus]|nr:hypothetical protein [Terriglobus roseus]